MLFSFDWGEWPGHVKAMWKLTGEPVREEMCKTSCLVKLGRTKSDKPENRIKVLLVKLHLVKVSLITDPTGPNKPQRIDFNLLAFALLHLS